MPALSRWTLLPCAAAVFVLSGCADITGSNDVNAPAPAKALPSAVASLVKTDIGQYYGKPRPGTPAKDIQGTIDRLKTMPGVQSAALEQDGRINLQFLGGSTSEQREAAVKQLAALGDVEEGV